MGELAIYEYSIPLVRPLNLSSGQLNDRRVLLIRLRIDTNDSWAEVAPLPGYSEESIEVCAQQLKQFFFDISPADLPKIQTSVIPSILNNNENNLFPSVSFGLSQLLPSAAPASNATPIDLCPLVLRDDPLPNVDVIKIKVGQDSIAADIKYIKRILGDSNFVGELRLDANQQWNACDIKVLCESVDTSRIEWIEDPLINGQGYQDWNNLCDVPLALDESLYQYKGPTSHIVQQIDRLPVATLILKPTLIGHKNLGPIVQIGIKKGCRFIISSSFESPVGMRHLYRIAAELAEHEKHGLDTLKFFEQAFQHAVVKSSVTPIGHWTW